MFRRRWKCLVSRRQQGWFVILVIIAITISTSASPSDLNFQDLTCKLEDGESGAEHREEIASANAKGQNFHVDMEWGVAQMVPEDHDLEDTLRVIDRINHYMTYEVMAKDEYASIRGKCKNRHENCAKWAATGKFACRDQQSDLECLV